MIKNNLIKVISLTTLVMSLTVANPVCVNAEDNVNVEQIRTEIAEKFNSMFQDVNLTKDDVTKEDFETTVSKEFETNLPDEKLYYFRVKLGMNSAYYGLTSGNLYIELRGHSAGDLTVFKDGDAYARYEFGKEGPGPEVAQKFVWHRINDWSQDINYPSWYYLKDSIVQTGWIYDKGNWYYCYSNGQMAHDTIIDGYHLNSSGAWDY